MKLAITGIGLVGKRHAEAIGRSKGGVLAAVADPSTEAKSYCEKNNIPWYADLTDLLREVRPDGVILSTPNPLHVEQGLLCVAGGCPILVEKPIAVTSTEGETLTAAAREKGLPILVGHHRRHNPLIRQAKEIIDSGRLGEIRAVHSQTWFYKPDHYFEEAPWRKQAGAGPVTVNLVHDIDLIRYLCGEVISVEARLCPSRRGYQNEDTAAAFLELECGALASVTVSDSIVSPWSWEMTSGENLAFPQTGASCYQIGGSEGSLSIPDQAFWHYSGEKDWQSPLMTEFLPGHDLNPLVAQIEHFCAVIDGEPPLVSGEDALKTIRVVEMILSAPRVSRVRKNESEVRYSS